MKLRILSDIHLEFGDLDPGEGDVLVLAGDICTASSFYWRGEEMYAERYTNFFNKCVENYNKVFYVMGNHEHYNGIFEETEAILREKLPKGITLLHNQSVFYNGWHFVGATLWTDFFNGKADTMDTCSQMMNEYVYVWHEGGRDNITPTDILNEHRNSVEWLNQCLPTLRGNVMVITHHPPSFLSVEHDYVCRDTVGAYASDLEDLIMKHNIDIWAHGHVHGSQNYTLHGTNVICNPRGYYPKNTNPEFDSISEIELSQYEKNLL